MQGAPGALRVAALMTAAAALVVTGAAADLPAGALKAAGAIDGGAALGVLESLRRLTPRGPA